MRFGIYKIFSQLIEPLGLIWLIIVLYTLFLVYHKRIKKALLAGAIVLSLSILGNGYFSSLCLANLEKPYVVNDIDEIPKCDAIVMLGGTHTYSENEALNFNLNAAVDRVIMMVELARRGKCDAIVIGGGSYMLGGKEKKNGDLTSRWLKSWGVINVPVYVLPISRNTRDEALYTAHLTKQKKWQKLILVTSANHMKRAEGVFRKTGLDVIPAASDFKGLSSLQGMNSVREKIKFSPIPTTNGIETFSSLFHEFIGWYYYRLRGWI